VSKVSLPVCGDLCRLPSGKCFIFGTNSIAVRALRQSPIAAGPAGACCLGPANSEAHPWRSRPRGCPAPRFPSSMSTAWAARILAREHTSLPRCARPAALTASSTSAITGCPSLWSRPFAETERLFALPPDEKAAIDKAKSSANRGYEPLNGQVRALRKHPARRRCARAPATSAFTGHARDRAARRGAEFDASAYAAACSCMRQAGAQVSSLPRDA
jgi:hypothetical protein